MVHTCCFFIPVRTGAIIVSVLGVLAGSAFGVIFAKEIEDGMMRTPRNLPSARFVPFMSMASWMVLALLSLFGCVASWTARPRLASVYFWAFVAHYIFDLAFIVVTLFFCLKGGQAASVPCSAAMSTAPTGRVQVRDSEGAGLCAMPFSVVNIIVLVILGLYKLFSTFVIYVLFRLRSWAAKQALEKEAQKIMQQRPAQQWINYDADTTKNWSKFDD